MISSRRAYIRNNAYIIPNLENIRNADMNELYEMLCQLNNRINRRENINKGEKDGY